MKVLVCRSKMKSNGTDDGKIELVTMDIEDELDTYYNLIGCRTIDIVVREVNGVRVDVVCDDEALFVENPRPMAVMYKDGGTLFGNLVITGTADSEGNLTSLDDKTIELLNHRIRNAVTKRGNIIQVLMLD